MLWTESLIDVQKFPSGGTDLYIRLVDSDLGKINKKDHKAIIAAVVIIVSVIFPLCAYFLWKYRGSKQNTTSGAERDPPNPWFSKETRLKEDLHGVKLEEFPLFKFTTLADATDSFDIRNI